MEGRTRRTALYRLGCAVRSRKDPDRDQSFSGRGAGKEGKMGRAGWSWVGYHVRKALNAE